MLPTLGFNPVASGAALLSDPAANDPTLAPWARSPELAVVWDRGGAVAEVNHAFARKFGQRVDCWPGTVLGGLVHPDDLAEWRAGAAALDRPPFHVTREHRWRTAQGWRWLAWEETLLFDRDGQPFAVRSIGRDVTKRHLSEEHFAKLARAVEQSPVSIVMTTPGGKVQYVNPEYTRVTGYTLEEIFERELPVLREGHATEAAYRQFCATVAAGRQWRGELRTPHRDGGFCWEAVTVSPIRNHAGDVTHLLCLREDISQRKLLEEQLRQAQKMESLGTLAGGIAHDFNNVIAIIKGYAELSLARSAADAVQSRYLREMFAAAQRAARLVQQILTFSRKTDVAYRPMDLNAIVRELVNMLRETSARTLEYRLELDERLPEFAADPGQVQQVAMNLCVNARDALAEGGVMTLRTARLRGEELVHLGGDATQDYALLAVEDTGCGMPPEVCARIFEPFFTTKGTTGGTGLGLAVVYGIVMSHRGLLDVRSEVGRGTTFEVYLPLVSRTDTSPVAPAAGLAVLPTGHESILVVEDEPGLRELIGILLESCGYAVTATADGAEAAQRLADPSEEIDAVVLDVNLPRKSGRELIQIIRQTRPQVRVLVFSGLAFSEVAEVLREVEHHDFLGKPADLGQLSQRLRLLLDRAVAE